MLAVWPPDLLRSHGTRLPGAKSTTQAPRRTPLLRPRLRRGVVACVLHGVERRMSASIPLRALPRGELLLAVPLRVPGAAPVGQPTCPLTLILVVTTTCRRVMRWRLSVWGKPHSLRRDRSMIHTILAGVRAIDPSAYMLHLLEDVAGKLASCLLKDVAGKLASSSRLWPSCSARSGRRPKTGADRLF